MNSLLVTLSLLTAPAIAEDYPTYCGDEKFSIRTTNAKSTSASLLNEEEKADPEIGRKLASQPGPYGHSELGFRYLARLFGYPGKLGDKDKVENWLADQEIEDYQNKKGLKAAWDHWVTNPVKRLSVPSGRLSNIPADADARIFFSDRWDQHNHAHCVKKHLDLQFCENYLGGRKPEEGDRVYYAASGAQKCRLVRNPFGHEAMFTKQLIKQSGGDPTSISGGSKPSINSAK